MFAVFSWEKSTKCSQNPGLVNEFSATPRGQLNWTGPIANSSDSRLFLTFFFSLFHSLSHFLGCLLLTFFWPSVFALFFATMRPAMITQIMQKQFFCVTGVIPSQFICAMARSQKVPYKGAELHKITPAREPCVTDVLCNWQSWWAFRPPNKKKFRPPPPAHRHSPWRPSPSRASSSENPPPSLDFL